MCLHCVCLLRVLLLPQLSILSCCFNFTIAIHPQLMSLTIAKERLLFHLIHVVSLKCECICRRHTAHEIALKAILFLKVCIRDVLYQNVIISHKYFLCYIYYVALDACFGSYMRQNTIKCKIIEFIFEFVATWMVLYTALYANAYVYSNVCQLLQ